MARGLSLIFIYQGFDCGSLEGPVDLGTLCGPSKQAAGPQNGHMAMGQKPNRTPSEHPNPTTKIKPKMGGNYIYPKVPSVSTHCHVY